jgi:hypothetical protein
MPDFAGIPPVLVTLPAEHKSLPVRSLEALLEQVRCQAGPALAYGISPQDPSRLAADQEESLIAAEPHVVRVP